MAKKPALGRGLAACSEKRAARTTSKDSELLRKRPDAPTPAAGVVELPVTAIRRNPRQPRRVFDPAALEELATSIASVGVVQPVIVRKTDEGYELIAGERRWRAAQQAGFTVVPAIVRAASDVESLELALVENVVRQQLNPVDEAFALKVLLEDLGVTQEKLAARVGKSRSAIANKIRLLDLPAPIQESLASGALSEGHARALLSLGGRGEQVRLARRIAEKGLSVRQVEDEVRRRGEAGDVRQAGRAIEHTRRHAGSDTGFVLQSARRCAESPRQGTGRRDRTAVQGCGRAGATARPAACDQALWSSPQWAGGTARDRQGVVRACTAVSERGAHEEGDERRGSNREALCTSARPIGAAWSAVMPLALAGCGGGPAGSGRERCSLRRCRRGQHGHGQRSGDRHQPARRGSRGADRRERRGDRARRHERHLDPEPTDARSSEERRHPRLRHPDLEHDSVSGPDLRSHHRQRDSHRVSGAEQHQGHLKDAPTVAKVLAAGVETGATLVSGPDWRLRDDSQAVNEALKQAVANARAKAETLAAAAGRVAR